MLCTTYDCRHSANCCNPFLLVRTYVASVYMKLEVTQMSCLQLHTSVFCWPAISLSELCSITIIEACCLLFVEICCLADMKISTVQCFLWRFMKYKKHVS